jgi:hypothetical protein
MKYKIKPYGIGRYKVFTGFPCFPFYKVLDDDLTWITYDSAMISCSGTTFGSVDSAKDAIKTSIIKHGICLAHQRQHKKTKTVVVPPWK